MIVKTFKNDSFEIVIQQDELTGLNSVSLLKNSKEVEFQGNLDTESALEVFDYYLDRNKGNDMTSWKGTKE